MKKMILALVLLASGSTALADVNIQQFMGRFSVIPSHCGNQDFLRAYISVDKHNKANNELQLQFFGNDAQGDSILVGESTATNPNAASGNPIVQVIRRGVVNGNTLVEQTINVYKDGHQELSVTKSLANMGRAVIFTTLDKTSRDVCELIRN